MKIRYIFFILICLFFIGCSDQGFLTQEHTIDYNILVKNHAVVTIEGCEYIIYSSKEGYSGYGFMAHKGNCRNSIHIYKE